MIQEEAPKEIDIELDDSVAAGKYANLVIISHSSSEFVLDFASIMPGVQKARVQDRIVMAPEHAKRLLLSLQENITRYETTVGPITLHKTPAEEASEKHMARSFTVGEA